MKCCPLELCLSSVVACDGFMYSKKGLERWIATARSRRDP